MSSYREESPVSPAGNRMVGAALIFGLLVIVALSTLDNLTDVFGKENYRVKAYFRNIGELRTGAPVAYGGVKVGRVRGIELQQDGRILLKVELFLKNPVAIDSILAIDSTTVSGDTFVSVIRGDSTKMISPAEDYHNAPIMRNYDYFGFGDIAKLASTIGGMAQESFGNFKILMDGEGTFSSEVKKLQKTAPQIKQEYEKLVKRYRESEDFYGKKFSKIGKVVDQAQALKDKINNCFTPEQVKHNQDCIESISYNRAVIEHVWGEHEKEYENFQHNYKILSARFSGFGMAEHSVMGLLLSDGCMGIPETVKALQEAVAKVADMSLLKKLGFYFKGKDLYDNFAQDLPPSARMDASSLYRRWAEFMYRHRTENLRNVPTSCQIKNLSADN